MGWALADAHERGAVLAGCSAGAMVLAGHAFDFRFKVMPWLLRWRAGLGFVPGASVLPHYDAWPEPLSALIALQSPRDSVVLGIDEETAAVGRDGSWQVHGRSRVTVWRGPPSGALSAPARRSGSDAASAVRPDDSHLPVADVLSPAIPARHGRSVAYVRLARHRPATGRGSARSASPVVDRRPTSLPGPRRTSRHGDHPRTRSFGLVRTVARPPFRADRCGSVRLDRPEAVGAVDRAVHARPERDLRLVAAHRSRPPRSTRAAGRSSPRS